MADPKKLAQALAQMSSPDDEAAFQQGIRATPWFSEFTKQYGEEPDLRPVSEDPSQGPNYDYRKAWASGVRPEPDPYDQNRMHWPSSTDSGDMLKAANHPTAWKEYFMRAYGVNPDSLDPAVADQLRAAMPGGGH